MSLRDTIDAAKREAQEAGSIFSGKEKKDADNGAQQEESSGFSKRSTARAKPATAAASSVRVVSAEDAKEGRSGKKTSEMTKEERKADRAARRDADDRRVTAANIILKNDPEYKKTQKVWWILLGSGLALTIFSFGVNAYLNRVEGVDTDFASRLVVGAMVTLVLAYACIIGAFIYDLVKARPIRKRVDAEVKGLTKKKLEQIIREDAEK
ncbi:MAG: hypothetical protein IJ092_14470 [Atopobiaceae bacterium]|nr:hypothetical protein [Atopobiaceae bacterium]MBR1830129.1 hypothetical protein [Atopobiaceae bacterium]